MSTEYEYKLSVVVLVYNTEIYLRECLNSLVNQTLEGIEIICVNDESTDNSLNILKQFANKYDNVKIIDQKNQGGANAGNNGLKVAKGEYVALVDSDDILVKDAYEKLYKKAKETDSDIVAGKPNIYISGYQREITNKHELWEEERTFRADEFLDIFYDVFYWNKIYRREFVEKNNIYMIPNKIYADVPLVHRSYLFADKISIIPDVVYYWRKRSFTEVTKGDTDTSVSKSLLKIDNMKDRLVTYYYLKDYFKEAGKEQYFNEVIKGYLERFFYPINGVLKDKEFEIAYFEELKAILSDIDDVFDMHIDLKYKIFIYFILHDMPEDLEDFLNFYLNERDVKEKDGKLYWNLKYFENPDYNIPDEIFEINKIEENFVTINNFHVDKKYINIDSIDLPKHFNIDDIKFCFYGLTKLHKDKRAHMYRFDLEENESKTNSYKLKLPIKELEKMNINNYDIYLEYKYDGHFERLRIKEKLFEELDKENLSEVKRIFPYFTKFGNFSIINAYSKGIFKIESDDEKIRIIPQTDEDINYRVLINYKKQSERVYFTKARDEEGEPIDELEIKWKFSVDPNIPYTLYLQISKKMYKLTDDFFKDFKEKTVNFENSQIRIFKDTDKSISIRRK